MKALVVLVALAWMGTSCSGPTTSTDMVFDAAAEGPATFAQVQETIFDVSCASSGCHGRRAWPNLSAGQAYDNIVNVESSRGIALVKPGGPDNSYLYLKLLPDADIDGARMPPGGSYLTPDMLETVRAWIENGAPNDYVQQRRFQCRSAVHLYCGNLRPVLL